nr:hypothetical protein [Pedobacter sp. ASV19]
MKIKILLILCIATLGLASCKKETIVDSGLPNQTIETVIKPAQWSSTDNGTRLTTTISFPEIDAATFKNDGVLVYIYPDNSVGEYVQVPFVYNSQSYTATVRQGSITVNIQTADSSNNFIPTKPTTTLGLRVVLVTSSLN